MIRPGGRCWTIAMMLPIVVCLWLLRGTTAVALTVTPSSTQQGSITPTRTPMPNQAPSTTPTPPACVTRIEPQNVTIIQAGGGCFDVIAPDDCCWQATSDGYVGSFRVTRGVGMERFATVLMLAMIQDRICLRTSSSEDRSLRYARRFHQGLQFPQRERPLDHPRARQRRAGHGRQRRRPLQPSLNAFRQHHSRTCRAMPPARPAAD